jgi:hypothetical protein
MIESTFSPEDCIYLLEDFSNEITIVSQEEKEARIHAGYSYGEVLGQEAIPSPKQLDLFHTLTSRYGQDLANYIATLSMAIHDTYENPIIVSLARAGTPIGALIKRYLKFKFQIDCPHYSVSIIRNEGIDFEALDYICAHHKNADQRIVFIDAWTGKGGIGHTLMSSVTVYNASRNTHITTHLAVISDPAHTADMAATKRDICIPSACLNATVSGLVSRTVTLETHRQHGAVIWEELAFQDQTNFFLDEITQHFPLALPVKTKEEQNFTAVPHALNLLYQYIPVRDIERIKLGIGESFRAILRRLPTLVIVNPNYKEQAAPIIELAEAKGIYIGYYDLGAYACAVLIS